MTDLPNFTFTGDGETVDLWPEPPDDLSWGDATKLGRDRAADLIEVLRRTNSTPLLGHVVDGILKSGRFEGVEVGFFHVIASEIVSPSSSIVEFVEVPERPGFKIDSQRGHLRSVAGCGG